MSSTDLLAHFANWKLAGDRAVRDFVQSFQSTRASVFGGTPYGGAGGRGGPAGAFFGSARGGTGGGGAYAGGPGHGPNRHSSRSALRRRRRGGNNVGKRVGTLSDAELEAELASRRDARARERARYKSLMRSEKLAALEEELMRLRGEISRIDPDLTRRAAGLSPLDPRNTHPKVSWDLPANMAHDNDAQAATASSSYPPSRRRGDPQQQPPYAQAGATEQGTPPPPPPPMRRPADGEEDEFDDLVIDPEVQKREKAERQRRREENRKRREAAKKPMTLAEIIRGAGPNPIRLLKPASKKHDSSEADEASQIANSFSNLRETLLKPSAATAENQEDSVRNDSASNVQPTEQSSEIEVDPANQDSKQEKEEPASDGNIPKTASMSTSGTTDNVESDQKVDSAVEKKSSHVVDPSLPKTDDREQVLVKDNSVTEGAQSTTQGKLKPSQGSSEPRDQSEQAGSIGGTAPSATVVADSPMIDHVDSVADQPVGSATDVKTGNMAAISAISALASTLTPGSARLSAQTADDGQNLLNASPLTNDGSRPSLAERRQQRRANLQKASVNAADGGPVA